MAHDPDHDPTTDTLQPHRDACSRSERELLQRLVRSCCSPADELEPELGPTPPDAGDRPEALLAVAEHFTRRGLLELGYPSGVGGPR